LSFLAFCFRRLTQVASETSLRLAQHEKASAPKASSPNLKMRLDAHWRQTGASTPRQKSKAAKAIAAIVKGLPGRIGIRTYKRALMQRGT